MRIGTLEVCLTILALAGLSTPPSAAAQRAAASLPPAAAAELEAAAAVVPGLSVAVGVGGEVRWAEGFGLADLELAAPVTPETRFLVYSAAKAWTAAAAARLAERGELTAEQPIGELLPGLPEALRAVTPLDLALHRAGVRHYADASEAVNDRHCATVADALPIFVDDPLLFEPGTRQAYSSWGYVLLSAVLERAAGSPFAALLEREIFAPAGMTGVVWADPYPVLPQRAEAYGREGDGWRNLPALDVTCKWGAGGFLATPTDLARFYLALFEGELVGPGFRPLLLRTDADSLLRFGGASAGGRSVVVADPRAGWVVALAANTEAEGVDLEALAVRLAESLELHAAPEGTTEVEPGG